jgi:phosphoribosylglycinamide formyltransferase-1
MDQIAVLVSGEGSTLQNLIDASREGRLRGEIGVVISDRPAKALERAGHAGIPAMLIERRRHGAELSERIRQALPPETRLIVLGGFLSILSGPILRVYRRRILNIHPSLLPKHGGAGMYGLKVHRAVLAAGEGESGCTVHYVDEGTDTGPIILQRRVPVLKGDTPESLKRRVAEAEREAIVAGVNAALDESLAGAFDDCVEDTLR